MSLVEDWKDRVPTEILSNGAIRYEQFDSSGNSLGYVYMKRADEPTEVGNIWNKVTYDGLKEAIEHKKYVVGTYTGNSNNDNVTQDISLSFTPSMVFVVRDLATSTSGEQSLSAMAITGSDYVGNQDINRKVLSIKTNGFTVNNYVSSGSNKCMFNKSNVVYKYIAFE